MLNDNFGAYEVTFSYTEPSNNKNYEMRKYVNSKKIKSLGGMYAVYCEEDKLICFRRNEYMRDRAFVAMCNGSLRSCIHTDTEIEDKDYHSQEPVWYHLPDKIDRNKLTKSEFTELRKLIKKGLTV